MKVIVKHSLFIFHFLVIQQITYANPLIRDSSGTPKYCCACFESQKNVDTVNVKVNSIPPLNNKSLWDYILPLMTILLSGIISSLIAFYSIQATFRRSINLENLRQAELRKKELSEYCGTVYALHTIIQNCNRQSEQVKSTLDSYKQVVLSKREFPFSDLGFRLRLDFLTNSTYEFLKYRQYETKIAAHLITYIHSAHNFNDFVDFQQVISSKAYFTDDEKYWQSVEEYFNNLLKRLDALSKGLETLTTTLEEEMNKYPEEINVIK